MITEIDRLSLKDWNLLKKLDHKKVVKFYDIQKIKNKVYMINDYYVRV